MNIISLLILFLKKIFIGKKSCLFYPKKKEECTFATRHCFFSLSIQICSLINLMIIIALNLATGFIPFVNNSAHIGGFIAGFFLGFANSNSSAISICKQDVPSPRACRVSICIVHYRIRSLNCWV